MNPCRLVPRFLSSTASRQEWRVPKEPYLGKDQVIGWPDLRYDQWKQQNQQGKYSLVVGFISGLMCDLEPEEIRKDFFRKIGGMTANQIVDTIDKFYRDYPQVRDKYPVFGVILSVLPRYRSGEDPLGEKLDLKKGGK